MPKPAKIGPDQERINLIVEGAMRSAIRDFRFQNRYDSEGEAVRELLRFALEQQGFQPRQAA
jgi:Arc/MetJ-type ribon-helix-helix transcriptional regulator